MLNTINPIENTGIALEEMNIIINIYKLHVLYIVFSMTGCSMGALYLHVLVSC